MKNYNDSIGLIALSNLKGIGPAFIKKYSNQIEFKKGNFSESIFNVLDYAKKECNNEDVLNNIEKGIKQSDLAKLLGISRQSLSDIEHRRIEPRRDLMLKIADALNEDVSILFFNE